MNKLVSAVTALLVIGTILTGCYTLPDATVPRITATSAQPVRPQITVNGQAIRLAARPQWQPVRDDASRLRKLADLQDRYKMGLCTEEEFTHERDQIMNDK